MDNKILIIDPFGLYKKRVSGIYTAIKSYLYCLEMIGYKGHVIDERVMGGEKKLYKKLMRRIINESEIDSDFLKKFDIIHVHGPLGIRNTLKLFRCKKPAILTLHGWVVQEKITAVKEKPKNLHFVLSLLDGLILLFNWLLHRLLFIPLIYKGRVTAVSRVTMEKNGVNGIVIPNSFIPAQVDKKVAKCRNLSFDDNFTFITYVSKGGSKVATIPRLSRIITEVNKRTDRKIQLLVFGDSVKIDDPHIKMMGYHPDFLCYLKSAEMMLLGYEMSELGYAVLEAGYLGVPVAKFRGEYEELEDGVHGIIAENEEEMIKKLVEIVENPVDLCKWSENIKRYILESRSPEIIANKWLKFLESTLEEKKC